MSKRIEEVLENSKNKNSPCPKTPSPFCEGLEDRRNLSTQENKLYSAIGIKKNIFKQNNPKKVNPLKPTEEICFF